MIQFRGFVTAATIVTITASCFFLKAQTAASPSKFDSITLNIALDKYNFPVGRSPWVVLTMNNRTDHDLYLHGNWDQLHIEGEKGEPRTTLRQRMTTGKLLRGDVPMREDENVETVISTGKSLAIKFDVKYLYDLSEPGKYRVYVDVKDPLSGKWLRTNTAQFKIQSQAQ